MAVRNRELNIEHIALTSKAASEWTKANPVLLKGEIGIESDTQRMKCGNGSDLWNALPYTDAGVQSAISNLTKRVEYLEELAGAIMEVTSSIMDNIMKGEVNV